LIGADSEAASAAVTKLYEKVSAPLYVTSIEAAEMVKYACNSFHGVKVTFANEIGMICKELGIDSHDVMDVFCQDSKLNLSAYYLKPGFAFGGSCLPKDLRALTHKAKELDLRVPLLDATLESNLLQIERIVQMILRTGKKRIGVLGFSFKAGTDDVRESPVVSVIERLIGKGLEVRLYDREVSIAKLMGGNKEFLEREIPHISKLMTPDVDSLLDHAELVLIGNRSEEFLAVGDGRFADRIIIDLVRLFKGRRSDEHYRGICW
jgi:GDP-mannose 6-dehydrogenase